MKKRQRVLIRVFIVKVTNYHIINFLQKREGNVRTNGREKAERKVRNKNEMHESRQKEEGGILG